MPVSESVQKTVSQLSVGQLQKFYENFGIVHVFKNGKCIEVFRATK